MKKPIIPITFVLFFFIVTIFQLSLFSSPASLINTHPELLQCKLQSTSDAAIDTVLALLILASMIFGAKRLQKKSVSK